MKRVGLRLIEAACLCVTAIFAPCVSALSPPPIRPPQVWIDPAFGAPAPIELQDVAIDVRIEGFVATTRVDLTFFNPNNRVLEGEFVFPLASGQSITGYALEVNGKLREGVVVEKETARVAFEETSRRRIDPGLAELTRGNVFRTRLYPIPAHGSKRVAIAFDQPLVDVGANYRYVLPLQFASKVRRFKVHAEAVRGDRAPQSVEPKSALTFARWHDSFVADLERNDFQPERELAFSIDKPTAPVTIYTVQDKLEPAWRTFAAQVNTATPAQTGGATPIRRLALYYDASGSARARDRERESEFLAQWFATLKNVDVDLIAFRNEADPAQHFEVRDGDSAVLRAAIAALPLDGGSSYGAIRLDAANRPDAVVVVGDAISNFGAREPQLGDSAPRTIFLHAAQSVDTKNFARWSRRYGAPVLNLVETPAAEALRQMAATPWMLQAMRVVHGDCNDLAPAAPLPVGAVVGVYGLCRGAAEIELQFGNATGASAKRTVRLDDAAALDPDRGAFVARLWATARIGDLQLASNPDAEVITDLAKRYGIVTENTSMLVLDRIEDYVRYRVEPREPDLLAEYQRLVADQAKFGNVDAQRTQLQDQVLRNWLEFKKWHDTRHPWLETVLQPAAEAEIARRKVLPKLKDARARMNRAEALAKQAEKLQERWLRDGTDETKRTAWEKEASALMLELDALRQQRLAQAPESDNISDLESTVVSGSTVVGQRITHLSPPPRPAQAMPAPPPPPPAPPPSEAPTQTLEVLSSTTVAESRAREAKNGAVANPQAATAPPSRIELQDADTNKPYLLNLRTARDPYEAYLKERERQASSPSFYLDCADYLRREAKNERLALRVLSNLAELDTESVPLLRVLAYRLEQWGRFDLAVPLFEDALKLRGEEPQSYRDLALALTRQGEPDYARAVDLLWTVANRRWSERFPEIQTIVLHELNDALARAPEAERAKLLADLRAKGMDERLLDAVPVDLRVVLTWDADNTDIDLWVIDPTGEVAIYSYPRTKIGGHMSRDFTGGYGPEVFTIRRPIPGTYTVKANYYGSNAQKLLGDVTVQAEFLTQFDTGLSKREAVTRRLENRKEVIQIGTFVVGAK
jgi:Ca-activated chloride channel family protein